jgi:RNase H-fold protein (predicted Holliday junction resolvase)
VSSTNPRVILAVDPGREKCGLAVLSGPRVLTRRVVATGDLPAVAARLAREFGVNTVALGDRTASVQVRLLLAGALPPMPIVVIDEAGTTEAARGRYFAEHPPRGWKRLLPLGMLVPPEPYDDYVAILLAERFLASRPGGAGGPQNEVRGPAGQEEKT